MGTPGRPITHESKRSISFFLPIELFKRFKEITTNKDLIMSAVIRRLIEEWVSEQEN